MDAESALLVIRPMAEGIDPFTGEEYAPDSSYQNVRVVRALMAAVASLEQEQGRDRRRQGLPANAGMPWSPDEDDELAKEFETGMTIREIARAHQRTGGAVQARLEKLGKLESG